VPYGRGDFGHQGGAQLVQLVIGLGQRRYGGLPGPVVGSGGHAEPDFLAEVYTRGNVPISVAQSTGLV
jgi:hypothetical protein